MCGSLQVGVARRRDLLARQEHGMRHLRESLVAQLAPGAGGDTAAALGKALVEKHHDGTFGGIGAGSRG